MTSFNQLQLKDLLSLQELRKNMTIPNLITLLRILLLPFFVYFFFSEAYSVYYSLGILLVCGLTDALDGFIARRFHMASPLGQVLDPLADKLAILTIFISFLLRGFIPLWIAVVILAREVLVLLFSIYFLFSKTQLPEPIMTGKYAITLLYVAVVLSIFHQGLSLFFLVIALVFSLSSSFSYALLFFGRMKKKETTSM